jgi:hypothetical protein
MVSAVDADDVDDDMDPCVEKDPPLCLVCAQFTLAMLNYQNFVSLIFAC